MLFQEIEKVIDILEKRERVIKKKPDKGFQVLILLK